MSLNVYAVATFVVVAILSMLFTRVATGALIATGLPPEIAAFQARSAFTGSGFTTVEAENVVNHPVRRRVISTTMLVGNLGTPTLIVTVLLGFLAPGPGDTAERAITTVVALFVVLLLLKSGPVTRALVAVGRHFTERRLLPALSTRCEELITFGDEFVVAEVWLERDPELAPRSLRGLDQALRGTHLLGVRHAEPGSGLTEYVGEPPVDIELHADDGLVLYGRRQRIEEIVSAG